MVITDLLSVMHQIELILMHFASYTCHCFFLMSVNALFKIYFEHKRHNNVIKSYVIGNYK